MKDTMLTCAYFDFMVGLLMWAQGRTESGVVLCVMGFAMLLFAIAWPK